MIGLIQSIADRQHTKNIIDILAFMCKSFVLLWRLDIGGGKGHLSRVLALQFGMNVTSMDCNANNILYISFHFEFYI